MDEGGFVLDYLMPAGSSLKDTNDVLLGVEKILQSHPGGGKYLAAHRTCSSALPPSPKRTRATSLVRLKSTA